ncbi:U-box domain-containing protein 35-like [Papaver somniferum]|uniref:U-box domain-containing protein 35-like n=1 Tax=Papaver somniferum TaxID=3469 RepID=UPI000E6F8911|nr:U-box domain-containing protein 35-like [Papaver somniferum]
MNGTKPNGKDQIRDDEYEIDDKLYTNGFNSIYETGSNSSSCSEIEEIDEDNNNNNNNNNSSIRRETNRIGFLSFNDKHRGIPATIEEGSFEGVGVTLSGAQNIYVAVGGKLNSSLDALRWTLRHHPSTMRTINLIHVFPEVSFIPSPFGGRVPKDQVSPEELENYMSHQSHKRREFLQKFLDVCSVFKVTVETLLIESNNVAKAVADLILILNIKKLVVGTSKSSYKKLKKANGIGDQILKSASDACDIKIINNGKELAITEETMTPAGESPASTPRSNSGVIDETKTITVNGQSSASPLRRNSSVIDETKTITVNGQSSAPSSRRNSRPSSRRNSSNNVLADFDLDDLVKGSGSLSPFSCFASKFCLKQ